MCGIVGYVGRQDAVPILIDGLRRVEYRGYDSSGLAVYHDRQLRVHRAAGKLQQLEQALQQNPIAGSCGIAHTRWATHGGPTEANAHPHRDCSGDIVVVHNGIVENYFALRRKLQSEGHQLVTETDSEVIAHLVEKHSRNNGSLETALRRALREIQGVFALALLSRRDPEKIVVARSGPPLILGVGEGEYWVASDIPALLHRTRNTISLADGDLAVLTRQGYRLMDRRGSTVQRPLQQIQWDPVSAEKAGYKHFMLKEIFEQPQAVRDTVLGRVHRETGQVLLDEVSPDPQELARVQQVRILACGTSWHAGLAGKFMIERLARLPVEVDYSSEFRYRNPIVLPNTLSVVITQSGETADTLAAQREAKEKGSATLAICNVVGSMATQEAKGTIYTHAGPEIGVASTKAFTAQLTALFLLALKLAQAQQRISLDASLPLVEELLGIPAKIEQVLQRHDACEELARDLYHASNCLFLGRGIHYPIALEGALKLKEISYIHAEGYPAGEMKHGPNALIDRDLPVVVVATHDPACQASRLCLEKTLSNIQEVRARQGRVIAVANQGDGRFSAAAAEVLEVPPAPELLLPIIEIVPLQLLAYHIANLRGCDVDQPRNLAKSVTVE